MTGVGIPILMASLIDKCLIESGAADRIVRGFHLTAGEGREDVTLLGSIYILSLPVFFDTMFYLLTPIARSMRARTDEKMARKISTIGGMIANDASGMQTVKYGEIHNWIFRLEAVLPDGAVIETGSRAAKTSSGYNLVDLLVGSEGTLAVVTEATLELAGLPEQIWGGRVIFEDRTQASAAIADVVQSGVDMAKIELIDELSAAMANRYLDADFPIAPMAFIELHRNHNIEDEVDFCRAILEEYGIREVTFEKSGPEMQSIWEVREEMASALKHYDPDLAMLTSGDVTVPISKYRDLIEYISTLEAEHNLEIPSFGHAGDGNIHYTVMVRKGDDEHHVLGERIDERIVRHAIGLGGMSTGEHGVGLEKQKYLPDEYNDETVDLMRRVKAAFDPNGILNPGKIF